MKLTLEEKTKVVELSEKASDLLVEILEEKLPEKKEATKLDDEFKLILSQMYEIVPLLSDSYVLMYNHIQKQKIELGNDYFKKLRES